MMVRCDTIWYMGRNVFLVRNVAPEMYGGGEIYQLQLAGKLRESGYEPIIVTNSKELLKNAKNDGLKVLTPPYSMQQNWSGWRNVLLPKYFVLQKRLKKWYKEAIEKYKPAVLNIQSRDDMIAGTLAAKEFGVKVLWTDHADFKNWVLWNVNSKFKNVIGKKIIRLSGDVDKVIFVSERIEEETKKLIAPKKLQNTIVVCNGVKDGLKKYSDISAGPASFVFIGRVVREKGVGELVNAFRGVVKKYPEATLNIYGDGEISDFKELSSGCENIHFCGVTNEPLKALAENQFFVLPSYMEGLSLSLLEAAMMKKTIIATDVGGNSEIIKNGETGLLVPPKNMHELSEKMIYILEHKDEANRLSKNVRIAYKKDYDFDKIFDKNILPLYNGEKEEE